MSDEELPDYAIDPEIKDGGIPVFDLESRRWKMEFSAYEWMLINMSMAVVGAIMEGREDVANKRLKYIQAVGDEEIFKKVATSIGIKGISHGREN